MLELRQGSEFIFAVRVSSCSETLSLGVSLHSVPLAAPVDPWLESSPCLFD